MEQPTKSHNQPEFTVSEISQKLKKTVENAFSYVRVRGEISGLKIAASGHVYFSLKDDNAVLSGICWKGVAAKLQFKPEDGLEVICVGKISTYPGRSNYQIICEWVEPAGEGALMALLEKRKKELAAEGLFDEERKKEIPFLPKTIGVVTSPTGAVIRDILHRIGDRFPRHVLVWPVIVQGEGADQQIASAIEGFNALTENRPDLLIVARGGGSLEDLWSFNEEIVVRATANSEIPLISAVGHETDTTLIDFASDRRAPTPTAAAEMAVPVREELRNLTLNLNQRLFSGITRFMENKQQFLEALNRGLVSPKQLLDNMVQRLDDWSERLGSSLNVFIKSKNNDLTMLSSRLQPQQILRMIEAFSERLSGLERLLESTNYKNILKKGFALVRNEKDELVTSAGQINEGEILNLEFNDGQKTVRSEGKSSKPPQKSRKKTKKVSPEEQGTLF